MIERLSEAMGAALAGNSLVDEGWYQLTTVLNFCVFNWPKKNSSSAQIILGIQSR